MKNKQYTTNQTIGTLLRGLGSALQCQPAGHGGSQRPHPYAPRRTPRADQLDTILCHGNGGRHHALPVRCFFKHWMTTRGNSQAAAYYCPLCKERQGWVIDYVTHRPRRLFIG